MHPTANLSLAPDPVVLPDCCNMGVVLRALLVVNAAALAASIAGTADLRAALQAFTDSAAVVELSTMLSLLLLCALRSLAGAIPAWLQRLASAAVPAAVTAAVIWLMAHSFGTTASGVWAGAMVAALLGAALQHYFALRMRAYSPALAEARLQALQARIRPHFLFNSLNAVLSLIRTEPRIAETTLEDLSDLLRVLLRDARDMSTLEEEIGLCRQYLAIESLRLGERLQLDWDLQQVDEETIRTARIPALLLQPLLENAVHHGVEPSSTPVLIRIGMRRLLERIEITIANPLHATVQPGGNHMALSNIRERLALLYDVEGELSTVAADGQFIVRLRFPYQRRAS
jgi:two-component system sensor histidine kinase AlgZ